MTSISRRYRWTMLLAGLVGCGSQEMEPGMGASGQPLVVVESTDMGWELINRLDDDQKLSFDFIHQPFDQAITRRKSRADDEKFLKKVQAEWDQILFADVDKNEAYSYEVHFQTNLGELIFYFQSQYAPLPVRNFLALAKAGYFDGMEMRLQGDLALFGTAPDDEIYTVRSQATMRPPPKAALFVRTRGPMQSSGTSFAISLDSQQKLEPEIVILGYDPRGESKDLVQKISEHLKAKKGSVRIEKVEWTRQQSMLFRRMGQVALPSIEPDDWPSSIPKIPSAPGSISSSEKDAVPPPPSESKPSSEPKNP